jgi:hypothetical protein
MAGFAETPPGVAAQIAVLPEFVEFVKATNPVLFRKAVGPRIRFKVVPVATDWGLQGPEVDMGTIANVPSLAPTKRPPQRLKSIWPLAFSLGTAKDMGSPGTTPPTGTPLVKHVRHAGGGLSFKPTIRTAAGAPDGKM